LCIQVHATLGIRRPQDLWRGTDSQGRMDQMAMVDEPGEDRVTMTVGTCGDRTAAHAAPTVHQAVLPITVSGRRIGLRDARRANTVPRAADGDR
jgi:hypothetical protein